MFSKDKSGKSIWARIGLFLVGKAPITPRRSTAEAFAAEAFTNL